MTFLLKRCLSPWKNKIFMTRKSHCKIPDVSKISFYCWPEKNICYGVSSSKCWYDSNSGIKKIKQAIRNMMLPINANVSWFLKLDAMKKMAQMTKTIQPASWYFISRLTCFFIFSHFVYDSYMTIESNIANDSLYRYVCPCRYQ